MPRFTVVSASASAALVCELPEETLDVVAPATPEWRVRDVVAHLAGGTADIVSGNLADVASEEVDRSSVDARRDVPIGEVLDEWARCCAIVEPMIAKFDPLMRAMLLLTRSPMSMTCAVRSAFPASATPHDRLAFQRCFRRHRRARRYRSVADPARRGVSVVGAGEPTATVQTNPFRDRAGEPWSPFLRPDRGVGLGGRRSTGERGARTGSLHQQRHFAPRVNDPRIGAPFITSHLARPSSRPPRVPDRRLLACCWLVLQC